MSSASARFFFVLVLAINCILWSQSRYGQFKQSGILHGEHSLVKRISEELLNPSGVNVSILAEKECRPLSHQILDQCRHVQKSCPGPDTFLSINYLSHYFCADVTLRPLVFVGLLTWLIFLFSTLGISASDFFTPNLATIAQLLGLDENVAGVTFLAFGNGSPDVFSTFSAMRADSGSLAIGELMGAASFIVTCVVGSMCIIKPFRVDRGPFLRDVGFFTVAVSILLAILWDNHIHPWEAGFMIGLYLFYVGVVVIGTWWEKRKERKRYYDAMVRSEYEDEVSPSGSHEPYRDDPSPMSSQTLAPPLASPTPMRTRAISNPGPLRLQTDLPPRPASRTPSPTPSPSARFPQMPSFSLVGALEFRHVVASLQNQATAPSLHMFDTPVTPYAGGHYHSHSRSHSHSHSVSRSRTPRTSISSRGEQDPWDAALNGVRLDDRVPQVMVTPAIPDEPRNGDYLDSTVGSPTTEVPSIFRTPASPTASSDGDTESTVYIPLTKRQRVMHVAGRIYHTLFPSLHHFREQSILGQIASVFAAPAVMLLTITLPVVVTPYECHHGSREKIHNSDGRLVDFEEEGIERILIAEEEVQEDMHEMSFNKWLMATQCALAPLFCVLVLFSGTQHQLLFLIAAGIGGFAAGALVLVFSDKGNHPTARMARCSLGFFVAIVWIMAIADEVVHVLQTFGFIFGLSDAIIGLTIFAVGNSLADLVANMSVAVFAPIMGFSACFGGPMLNILLGIGISGSYIIQQTGVPYELHFSSTLMVSTVGLLVLLLATLLFVPLNGYFLTRRWGMLLIASYTAIMSLNVFVEVRGIGS